MPLPPDSADQAEPPPKRFLIAAGTSTYKNLSEDRQLPSVEEDLSRIVELFEGQFGYKRVLAGLGENPPHDYFRTQLSRWLKDPKRTESDIIVFYYSGHGAPEGGEHYLLMTDSDEKDFAGTAFPTASIGKMLRKTKIRHMMVIMDTCHAAMGGSNFGAVAQDYVSSLKADYGENFGLYTLAAARPKEEASQGEFSAAFERVVRNPPPACGNGKQAFLSSYDKLIEAINEDFRTTKVRQRANISSFGVQSAPLFIPNIRYRSRNESPPEHLTSILTRTVRSEHLAGPTTPGFTTEQTLKKRDPNFPETLINRLRGNRIIPFVGAGVSMSVRRRDSQDSLFPSWKELLRRAGDRLRREQHTDHASLVESLIRLGSRPGGSEKLLEAAREASDGLGSNWNDFLFEQLDHSIDEAADDSLQLARLVWNLRSRVVITTNYDKVLHWACPWHHDLAVWNIEAAANQVAMLKGESKRPVVWHLHGHVDDIANVILTPDGYSRLYNAGSQSENNYKAALETLKHQLASHSFLFVGFSLNDAHFSAQFRQVEQVYKGAAGPHYVLLSQAEADRLNRKDYPGIEVIPYDDHGPPLLAKLRELIAAAEPMKGTAPGATSSLPTTSPAQVSPVVNKTKGNVREKSPRASEKRCSLPDLGREVFRKERDSKAEGLDGAATGSSEFDDHVVKVKRAIKAKFDLLKDRRMLDDHGSVVGVLDQTSEKIKLSTWIEGGDLSEQLADFLTKRCDYHDLGTILIVFQRLRAQKKYDEARRISEIMDLMLPLCLPRNLVAEAWRQLKKDEKVLLRSGVGGRTGAELLVARLYRQHANFVDKNTSEPRGELFVALYEDFPIDDPDVSEAAVFRDLYVATHHTEVKEIDRQTYEISLTIEEIKKKLRGHFESIGDFQERPSYCVLRLPSQENDVVNLSNFLRGLKIPGLLFIGIATRRDQDVHQIESYVIQTLNTRYRLENES